MEGGGRDGGWGQGRVDYILKKETYRLEEKDGRSKNDRKSALHVRRAHRRWATTPGLPSFSLGGA